MALTTRDLEILSAAFQCLRDPDAFKVDYQKLATLAGFKSAASASNSFFLVKKKINAGAGAGAGTGTVAKAISAEKDSENNANSDEAGEPNHDEGPATPLTPIAKKRAKKAKAPPTSAEDTNGVANGEENEDEPTVPTPSTPKKRTRKPKAEPQSGDEATTPKKRARKAAKPKAEAEAKVVTPHSGGDEDSILPTPASPSPAKKRARKPSSAKRAKKSAEIVTGDASADEAENDATASTIIANTNAKLSDGYRQFTPAIFGHDVAQKKVGTSAVLAAEIAAAAAAANEYSKGGQSKILALVAGDDDVPADEMDDNVEEEITYAAGQAMTSA